MYIYIYTYICMYMYIYIYTCVCMNVSMDVCLYGCMCYLIKHALSVIDIIALWQLVHLGTPMYGYMLHVVGFQDSKKVQVHTTATSIIVDTNIYLSIYLSIYLYIYIYIIC